MFGPAIFPKVLSPEILQLTIVRSDLAKHQRKIAASVTSIGDRVASSRQAIAGSRRIIAKANRVLDATVFQPR
jgi:hypothetical protein